VKEKIGMARTIIKEFKGNTYTHGLDCYERLGALVASVGQRAAVVMGGVGKPWGDALHEKTIAALAGCHVQTVGDTIPGARPNAPREDVWRIKEKLAEQDPDVVVCVGGGSAIDAVKAAVALQALAQTHPDIEEYFGVGRVSEMLEEATAAMSPIVAVQTVAGSGAHLTKYSNVTDMVSYQKKLIVDEAIVPAKALFDYAVTVTTPQDLTADGALDGIAHALEVFYGTEGEALHKVAPISTLAIELIVGNVKKAVENPTDLEAREALGLGTDLGAYAIMIGGTNGAHLTSFSLVDVLSHGRACALMNPYYTVFFAPAIQKQLKTVARIFKEAGYISGDIDRLSGRSLGLAVAESMLALSRDIFFPLTLSEVDGFTDEHIERALVAAKSPQLQMKLKNMPVPLSAAKVDEYMGPVLEAAKTGDFSLIKNMR